MRGFGFGRGTGISHALHPRVHTLGEETCGRGARRARCIATEPLEKPARAQNLPQHEVRRNWSAQMRQWCPDLRRPPSRRVKKAAPRAGGSPFEELPAASGECVREY